MKCDRFASMLLILCMVLAGCTGPAAPEEGETAAERPAPEAPAAEEAEPLTMLVFPPDDVALYAEAFTEQTQVEIEFAEPSNAAFEQMLTDFAAGKSTYDIVGVDNALGSLYTMDPLLDQGYFLPLTDAPNVGEAVGQMLPSQGEPTLRTASHGGVSYPLPGAEPVCYAGAPVCKVGEWNLVYLEERDGVRYFCFAALDEGAQRFAEVFRASYRLPEGEEIVQILEMHMDSPSAWRICFRTSAGKIYWHERRADGTADTRLVAADVVAAEGTLYADAFAISTQQSRLVRFRSDQETLKEFFLDRGDMPAELTAITAAYTGEYAHEPYGIFVFAVAEGKPRLFHMEIDSEGREASN